MEFFRVQKVKIDSSRMSWLVDLAVALKTRVVPCRDDVASRHSV